MEIVIAEMIKKLRNEKGMTMRQLGEQIGVSDSAVSQYETGGRKPPLDVCVKLANLFDVSLEVLIRGKEKDRPVGRSMSSVFNEYASLSQEELEYFLSMLQAVLAEKRFQAHLRQDGKETP